MILEAYRAGVPPSAIADRLIRISGMDADNAKKLVAAFLAKQKRQKK